MPCPPERLAQLKAIDPSIPDAQWHAQCEEQESEGGFDSGCPPDRPFRSARPIEGASGPVDNCVEKRENCPPGFRVIGSDHNNTARCLPGDAREFQQGPQPGQGPGQPGPGQPAAPTTFGSAGDLSYTGNPLIDALLYQFNTQSSLQTGARNIFGLPRYGGGAPETAAPGFGDVKGKLLPGGGLIWGQSQTFGPGGTPLGDVKFRTTPNQPPKYYDPNTPRSNAPVPELTTNTFAPRPGQPLPPMPAQQSRPLVGMTPGLPHAPGVFPGAPRPDLPTLQPFPGAPAAQPSSPLSAALMGVPGLRPQRRPKYPSLQQSCMNPAWSQFGVIQ